MSPAQIKLREQHTQLKNIHLQLIQPHSFKYQGRMERGLILLIATVMVFLTSGVRGTDHLSFDNTTPVNITRAGCASTKVCVEEPADCDPAGSPPCLFTSLSATPLMPPNGTDLSVELSGNSPGYIALGLTADVSMRKISTMSQSSENLSQCQSLNLAFTQKPSFSSKQGNIFNGIIQTRKAGNSTFVSSGISLFFFCAQNNGTFFFRTMSRNNSDATFTPVETIVNGIRSSTNGSLIQCEFTVPRINATSTRSSDANTFVVLLATGETNGTMIDTPPGPFVNRTVTAPIANSNVSATPATNMTTSGVSSFFTPHALLLPLSVLAMSVLKTV